MASHRTYMICPENGMQPEVVAALGAKGYTFKLDQPEHFRATDSPADQATAQPPITERGHAAKPTTDQHEDASMQREDKLSGSLTAIRMRWRLGPSRGVTEQPIIPPHIGIPTPDCLLDSMVILPIRSFKTAIQALGHTGFAPATCRFEPRLQPTVRDIWHSEHPDHFQVTQGSSGAIDMLGRSLLNPGDVVFTEYLTWALIEIFVR